MINTFLSNLWIGIWTDGCSYKRTFVGNSNANHNLALLSSTHHTRLPNDQILSRQLNNENNWINFIGSRKRVTFRPHALCLFAESLFAWWSDVSSCPKHMGIEAKIVIFLKLSMSFLYTIDTHGRMCNDSLIDKAAQVINQWANYLKFG